MNIVLCTISRRVWIGCVIMSVAASHFCKPAYAQGESPLTFIGPSSQIGPGGAVSSDPTIRPFNSPGVQSPILLSWSVDLQGNGRPDFIACHGSYPPDPRAKRPCRILRPQSDGSVLDITRQLFGADALPSLEHPNRFVSGDFNGDGRADIFVAATGYDAAPFDGETNLLLLSNPDGTYSDRSSNLPQEPDFSHSACSGDVNGDGNLDIYVGNLDGKVGPYLLLGNGDGTFVQSRSGLPATIIRRPNNSIDETFLACAIVDVDGDGAKDLVLGATNPNASLNSVVYFNNGSGDFTTRPRTILPTGPFGTANTIVLGITVLDVNRDGRPDLILMSQYYNPAEFAGFGLQVLINKGGGVFADETTARLGPSVSRASGPYCTTMRIADFNGDGWEDLYCDTNGWDDTTVRYWVNQGGGFWFGIPGTAMPAGSNRGPVQVVDFDGDGRPDLLQVGANSNADIFYRSFLNRTSRTVPSAPIIRPAVAGNAQAAVFFTPPLGRSTILVTGYTATCRQESIVATSQATAGSSPISVGGLTNGKFHACSVQANSAAGDSLPSDIAYVLPAPSAPLRLLAVKSRKAHGAGKIFDFPIDRTVASTGDVSVEPRSIGTGHVIVFQFNNAVTATGSATATIGSTSAVNSANDVMVTLTAVPDNSRVTLTLTDVNGIVTPFSASLGFLVGDVNGTRSVNSSDISGVKARSGQTTTGSNFEFDVNASGSVNSSDISATKARSGLVLP